MFTPALWKPLQCNEPIQCCKNAFCEDQPNTRNAAKMWKSTKHQDCKFTQICVFYIFHFDHLCDIQAGIMEKYLWNWCLKTLWLNKTRPRKIIRRAELSQNQEGYETIMHVQSQFSPNTKPFELCMLIVLLWLILSYPLFLFFMLLASEF